MTAYFTKDEYGNFRIPVHEQRPVFLMGPPGIGKTAIMEQIAEEMGVGLVAYSMTHHTRQSALGRGIQVRRDDRKGIREIKQPPQTVGTQRFAGAFAVKGLKITGFCDIIFKEKSTNRDL